MNRHLLAAVILAMVLPCSAAEPGSTSPAAAEPRTGVFVTHGDEQRLAAYEQWLGRKVDVIMEFTPDNTWDHLVGTKPGLGLEWFLGLWETSHLDRIVISLPMLPADGSGTVEAGAEGRYDDHFRAIAAKFVKAGYGHATLRIGWEFNAGWFKWSAREHAAAWRKYWIRIVTAMRSVEGAAFRFNWCGTVGDCGMNPSDAYPGDAYVDEVGCDIYDQSWHPGAYPYQAGEDAWKKPWRQDNGWKSLAEWGNYNLQWWSRFATEHGKPMTLPEWGLAGRRDGHGGLDNPQFIRRMHAWVHQPTNHVAWHSYFEEDNAEIRSRLFDSSQYPEAAAEYRKLFGGAAK